jgi:Putative beta-barrel porin-2, OmpL-like. bbp2
LITFSTGARSAWSHGHARAKSVTGRKAFALVICSTVFAGVAGSALAQQAVGPIAQLSTASADVVAVNATAEALAATGSADPAPAAAPAAPPPPNFGKGVWSRFWNYQAWEWGKDGPPADPTAPSSRRDGIPPAPVAAPPMPFTEWPYGGTTNMMTNRAASVDSPLMVAIADTSFGKLLSDAHIQMYGWVDVGANISTSHRAQNGNSPAAYDYNPNAIDLNQIVLYVERTPDTVQTDHIDWGFRVSGIYGSDYRYTTAFGYWSEQLLKHNHQLGYDAPMVYGELYVPKVMDGLLIRVGRFISLPDIEAQLAPNNYMYSHSLTYTFDNYTNTGVQFTLAATKNIFLQFGVTAGSDTSIGHIGETTVNPYPNVLYPGTRFKVDPGAKASYTACARFQSNSANDNIYFCGDALNDGVWGYNNLQWLGVTYYHKFNDQWHISMESYNLHQNNVPNIVNPTVQTIVANGGTPFSTPTFARNGPFYAQCNNVNSLKCAATSQTALMYLNYSPNHLNNFSLRAEYFNDEEGQRTGTKTRYAEVAVGWQHWMSPQLELRPELAYYSSLDAPAFNGNADRGLAPNQSYELILSGDVIAHF